MDIDTRNHREGYETSNLAARPSIGDLQAMQSNAISELDEVIHVL